MALELPDDATQEQRAAAAALEDFRRDSAHDLGRLVRLFTRALDHPEADAEMHRQLGQYIADGHAHIVEPSPDELRIAFRLLAQQHRKQHPTTAPVDLLRELIDWIGDDLGVRFRTTVSGPRPAAEQGVLHADDQRDEQDTH